jgi:C4-dicarboxylate-specific signal transduction histidine kinase
MTLSEIAFDPEREPIHPGHYEDVALKRGDGYPVYTELNVVHVEAPGYGGLAAYMARDTTERRQLERELVAKHGALYTAYADLEKAHADLEKAHAQLCETKRELEERNREIALLAWRAATGELVAGIAHHLNNPVGALASTSRRLRGLVESGSSEHRDELTRLVERITAIARRIELNVAAILQATRSNASSVPSCELPPELATVLSTFVDQLGEIESKERS